MEFRILPYKLGSQSSKLLATEINALRINPNRRTYRRKLSHKLVNWGRSHTHYEHLFQEGDYNHPRQVAFASDKRIAFQLLKGWNVPCPEWTENLPDAESWLIQGHKVYGRDTAHGHSGQGITVYQPGDSISRHLFYTKGVLNKREYRIHIGRGSVIDITQKKRRNGHNDDGIGSNSSDVRNYDNGWVFCRNDIRQPPSELIQVAIDSVNYLGLDFGAVDCCTTRDRGPIVFEVNTAPGIEGTTLSKYVEFFNNDSANR